MADGRNGSSTVCGHGRPGRYVKLLPLAEFLKVPIEHRCQDCQWSVDRKTREQQPAPLATSENIARHILCQVNPRVIREQ
jgi:hypothetical protein